MPRSLRIARFVLIQLLLLFVVVEGSLRVFKTRNQNLEVLLYLPSVVSEFDRIETLPDLLNTTIIGFNPYEQVAGFVRNSRGFRTREYTTDKDDGVDRIVLVGDSFTFSSGGIPYSDAWHLHLERRLQEERDDRIELLNLGVPGVGPLFERRIWQLEGSRLNPDVVLLALFVGNDFTDHFQAEVGEGSSAAVRWSYTIRLLRNLGRVLGEHGTELEGAQTLVAVDEDGGDRRGGYELPQYREAFANRKPFYSHERLIQIESQRMRLCDRGQGAAFDELFERVSSVVRDFHQEVTAAGVDFHVVVLPDRFQVNLHERNEALALLRMRPDQFDWDRPQRELRAFFEREGISALDLLPAFREITGTEQMFDSGNTHWNVRGNEFVGNEIAKWLGPRLPAER
jgi:hypothetical protein